MKNFDLTNKLYLVTGSNGQIGSEICRELKSQKAFVIGIDRDDKPDKSVDEYFKCDVSSKQSINTVFKSIKKKYKSLDCLINNAGASVFSPFEDRTASEIDLVTDTNLKGVIYCTNSFISMLPRDNDYSDNKNIVNVASHYGLVSPDPRIYTDCTRRNSEIYGATKAGIIQMTKYYAVHLSKYKIRVNCISPGGILNPQNPQGEDFQFNYSNRCPMERMGMVNEIVYPILFLSSNYSSYVNGHNFVVDGGFTCW